MYPDRELTELDSRKTALRRRITRRRQECAVAAARVLQPLTKVDQLVGVVQRLSPFAALAAVPLGFLFKRAAAPRRSWFGTLLRWGPVVLGVVRGVAAARRR